MQYDQLYEQGQPGKDTQPKPKQPASKRLTLSINMRLIRRTPYAALTPTAVIPVLQESLLEVLTLHRADTQLSPGSERPFLA